MLIALACFGLLAAPQLLPFFEVHLTNSGAQRSGALISLLRLSHGVFLSEALLPWHLAGLLFGAFVVAPLIVLQFRDLYHVASLGRSHFNSPDRSLWLSVFVFFAVMFFLGCVFGIGSKARSFLLLCPVFAFLAARLVEQIKRTSVRYAMIGITCVWIAQGSSDLLSKTGTAKGGINDHPEQVVNLVQKEAHGTCSMIFVTEPALTYALNEAAEGEPWTVCSVSADYIHSKREASTPVCKPEYVFVVESYVGALHDYKRELTLALDTAEETITGPQIARLSFDQDGRFKRLVPGFRTATADSPEFRFVVHYGRARPAVDWDAVASAFTFYQPPEWQGIADWTRSLLKSPQSRSSER